MKVDMRPEAISKRLKQSSDLRRLCFSLAGERQKISPKEKPCHGIGQTGRRFGARHTE